MKISFWIPAIVLYVVRVVFSNSVQVGTVLFTTTDLVKKCWTETDKSLLKARLIMQGRRRKRLPLRHRRLPRAEGEGETSLKNSRTLMTFSDVLPDPSSIDFSKPEAASILLDYIHSCYQVISKSSYGKIQNIMYSALSDSLGGYLRAYVLPFTRKAYYAGELKYSDAKKIFRLYDDIRIFLKTTGVGWTKPQKICYKKLRVKPLTITGGSLDACNQLYTIESEGKLHCINAPNKCADEVELSKNSEENIQEDNSESFEQITPFSNYTHAKDSTHYKSPFHNESATAENSQKNGAKFRKENVGKVFRREIFHRKSPSLLAKRVIIPLPVLDDFVKPHSIAVPFRKQPLRNLGTKNSAFILEQYYLAVIKCFIAKGNSRTDIKNFNSQFHSWLVSEVFPRLNDEKWYPAFGGVLRVMETIRKFGAETTVRDSTMHDIAYMFEKGVDFDAMENPKLTGRDKTRDVTEVEDCDRFAKRHYLTAVLVASLIWIFIFCACAFYIQATRGSYLLYEGRSGGTVVSANRDKRNCRKREDKFVNFEFLVKFFNKKENLNDAHVYHCFVENEKEKKFNSKTKNIQSHVDKETELTHQKEEEKGRKKEKGHSTMRKEGNAQTNPMSKPEETDQSKGFIQQWNFLLSPTKEKGKETKKERLGTEEGVGMGVGAIGGGGGEEVEMLWKKPSTAFTMSDSTKGCQRKTKERFDWTIAGSKTTSVTLTDEFDESSSTSYSPSLEDETKGYSTEKQSWTCCCSEHCPHSTTSYTKSSPETQLEKKFSSETINSSEKVKGKEHKGSRSKCVYKCHKGYNSYKSYKRSSTQKTSSESGEEKESFYSESETDY